MNDRKIGGWSRWLFGACALLGCFPVTALAYVGPGVGLGTLGVIAGLVLSVLVAVIAVVWYPLKRLFGRKRDTGDGS